MKMMIIKRLIALVAAALIIISTSCCTDNSEELIIDGYKVNNQINKKDMAEKISLVNMKNIYSITYNMYFSTMHRIEEVNDISRIYNIRYNNGVFYSLHLTDDENYTFIVFYRYVENRLITNGSYIFKTWIDKDEFLMNINTESSEKDVQAIDPATSIIIRKYKKENIELAYSQHIVEGGYIDINYIEENGKYTVDSIAYIESEQIKNILAIDKK